MNDHSDPIDGEEDELPVGQGQFDANAVNAIVQKRLARQRARFEAKYKPIEERLTQAEKELADAKVLAEKYTTGRASYLAEKRNGLPEYVQKLLDKLDPEAQLEWLEENGETIARTDVATPPQTPEPKGTRQNAEDLIAAKRAALDMPYGI